MKTELDLHKIKLWRAEDLGDFFNYDNMLSDGYFLKPKFKWLPEEDNTDLIKQLEEGSYLVGLDVISDTWVNAGFCGQIFNSLGLVLADSYPIGEKDQYKEKPMIELKFRHILFATHDKEERLAINRV